MRRFLGCCRFVWNDLLAQNEIRHDCGSPRLSYNVMCGYLLYLKSENEFLREAPAQVLQQTVRDLEQAYTRAFDPTLASRFPRYKKKCRAQGMRFPQSFKIRGRDIWFPKLGWIGFYKSRDIQGQPKSITISFDGMHWYATIQTAREVPEPKHTSQSAVGIDLGIARFAALSDGTFIEGANAYSKYQSRLALLSRRMSRKQTFSANWRRAKEKVARIQRKISNTRNDKLHKASTIVSKNHAVVVLEDLKVANMSASAKGSLQQPGVNVRAKSGLNRRILDQGWREFRRQLDYKLRWSGGQLVLVHPHNTSLSCSHCGHVSKKNRLAQSVFKCTGCGYEGNADTNAALNILQRAGQARIACGDQPLGKSMKQETQYA